MILFYAVSLLQHFSQEPIQLRKAPLIRDVGRLECVHFTGANQTGVCIVVRRSFRKFALKQRDRGRSVATLPPGTSRRTWSRQSVTSIPDRVSFPLPTSSLPLPGRRLYFWLLRVCLCRVFYPVASKAEWAGGGGGRCPFFVFTLVCPFRYA